MIKAAWFRVSLLCAACLLLVPSVSDADRLIAGRSIRGGSTPVTGCTDKSVLFTDVDKVGCDANLKFSGLKLNTPFLGLGASGNDAVITNDAFGFLAQRNGTNPQTFRLYSTFTDSANYERLSLGYEPATTRWVIDSQAAGTGTVRLVSFRYGGTEVLRIPDATKVAVRRLSSDPISSTLTLLAGSSSGLVVRNSADTTTLASIDTSGNLTPGTNATQDLGSSSSRWRDLYVDRRIGNTSNPVVIASSLAAPTSSAGDWWVQCTGTSPSRTCALNVNDGGTVRTIASISF